MCGTTNATDACVNTYTPFGCQDHSAVTIDVVAADDNRHNTKHKVERTMTAATRCLPIPIALALFALVGEGRDFATLQRDPGVLRQEHDPRCKGREHGLRKVCLRRRTDDHYREASHSRPGCSNSSHAMRPELPKERRWWWN